MLGLHHCLHHCDNLHIYLVIFSLFCLLLQSISPNMLCAAETGKEVQVVISEMTDFLSTKCHIFLVWKSLGKRGAKGQVETLLNKVTFLSPKCRDLCRWQSWRDWSFAEPQGKVKTVGIPGWPLIQRILQRPQPLNMLLSLSPGFSDRWGSGHKRRDKVEDPVFL